MARRKETIYQRDMALGAIRPEALDRDDTPLIERSLRHATNTVTLTTGQTAGRPGTIYSTTVDGSIGYAVSLKGQSSYEVVPTETGVKLFLDGLLIYQKNDYDWEDVDGIYEVVSFDDINFWVVADPERDAILIGAENLPIHVITKTDTGFEFGFPVVDTFSNDVPAVPMYNYHRGVKITSTSYTGSAVISSDQDVFTTASVGSIIRYKSGYARIQTYFDKDSVGILILKGFNRTIDITVDDASDFIVGDAVEHSTGGGTGVVTAVDMVGNIVTVLADGNYLEFKQTDELLGPNAEATVTSAEVSATVAETDDWAIEMTSARYGYAGSATVHQGRLWLCDFPNAPLAYAASVNGNILSFQAGAEDSDAFIETIGSARGGSLLYMVSSSDLLFFTTEGLYYQLSRDQSVITPTSIAPIGFSNIGCAKVAPAITDGGVVFVDRREKQIHAAMISGDFYSNWDTLHLTRYHSHLFTGTTHLSATSRGSDAPEDFLFAVQSDGSVNVCQWSQSEEIISWRPWTTQGNFLSVFQGTNANFAIVERTIDGTDYKMYERFSDLAFLDCAGLRNHTGASAGVGGVALFFDGIEINGHGHLIGETVSVYFEGWDFGDLELSAEGLPQNAQYDEDQIFPAYQGLSQAGFAFEIECEPWARRSINTQRGTRSVKRIVDLMFTVMNTGEIEINGETFGGYLASDDFSAPPPARSKEYRTALAGGSHDRVHSIKKGRPGPFLLSKIGYRVTI